MRPIALLSSFLLAVLVGCDDRPAAAPTPAPAPTDVVVATEPPEPAPVDGAEPGSAEAPATGAAPAPTVAPADLPEGAHVGVRRPAAPAAPGDPAAAPPGTSERAPAAQKPPPKGLEILPDNRWRVSRALADRWQENPYRLANTEEAGAGWRLSRVRPYGPGWYLGLRNGDVILTVNGHKLDTMPQLLMAYAKLKNDTSFEVQIRRGGQIRTHHYTIVD